MVAIGATGCSPTPEPGWTPTEINETEITLRSCQGDWCLGEVEQRPVWIALSKVSELEWTQFDAETAARAADTQADARSNAADLERTAAESAPRAHPAGEPAVQVEATVSEFSGLPVPRYASLRTGRVNGRAGPSSDYPVSWVYERAGLPVVIVRESGNWRKVRDPSGDETWVAASQLAAERRLIATANGRLFAEPQATAPVVATFKAGLVFEFDTCDGAWCHVTAAGREGYVPVGSIWGASPLPVRRS